MPRPPHGAWPVVRWPAVPERPVGPADPAAALADLRSARRRKRVADIHWIDALYQVYLAALVSLAAVLLLSSWIGGERLGPLRTAQVLHDGPDIVGVGVALAILIGLRSGARGGPLAIEPADARHVLLAPIDRALALRSPALHQLRFAAFVAVVVGGIGGQLAVRRLGDEPVLWILSGAAFTLTTLGLAYGAALIAGGRRLSHRRGQPRGRRPPGLGGGRRRRRGAHRHPLLTDGPGRHHPVLAPRVRASGPDPGGPGDRVRPPRCHRPRRPLPRGGGAPDPTGRPAQVRRHPPGPAHGHGPAPPAGHGAAPDQAVDPRAWLRPPPGLAPRHAGRPALAGGSGRAPHRLRGRGRHLPAGRGQRHHPARHRRRPRPLPGRPRRRGVDGPGGRPPRTQRGHPSPDRRPPRPPPRGRGRWS